MSRLYYMRLIESLENYKVNIGIKGGESGFSRFTLNPLRV
jgi:hypothetical protein